MTNLKYIDEGTECTIDKIDTGDREMDSFLISLGCIKGEPITLISRKPGTCVVAVKDGRYSIDNGLAESISVRI